MLPSAPMVACSVPSALICAKQTVGRAAITRRRRIRILLSRGGRNDSRVRCSSLAAFWGIRPNQIGPRHSWQGGKSCEKNQRARRVGVFPCDFPGAMLGASVHRVANVGLLGGRIVAVGRTCLLAFVGGVGAVQLLPDVSVTAVVELAVSHRGASVAVLAAVLLLLAAPQLRRLRTPRSAQMSSVQVGCERSHPRKTLVWILAFALSGVVYAVIRAEHRLSDALATDNEDKVTRVVLRVAELPRLG